MRHIGLAGESEDEGMHALIHYDDVRVPADSLLGGEGQAFAIAQTRLGGGRVHHAMRTVAICQRALDLLCERVLSRETQGSLLARKQFIQGDIADSYAELEQFRLLVLYTAWQIDQLQGLPRTRKDIAAIKALTPKVVHDAVWRSMHAHGALGVSNEMPFGGMWMMAPVMSVVDGPTEVHKITVAREVLKDYEPSPGPVAHRPPAGPARRGPGASWPTTSSTSSATPDDGPCAPPGAVELRRRPPPCRVEDVPDPSRARARSWWRWRRRPSTSPTCCWWPTGTRCTSRCRSPRAASSPAP